MWPQALRHPANGKSKRKERYDVVPYMQWKRIEVKINHNPKIKGWEQKSDGNLKSYVNGNTRLLIAIGEESE